MQTPNPRAVKGGPSALTIALLLLSGASRAAELPPEIDAAGKRVVLWVHAEGARGAWR